MVRLESGEDAIVIGGPGARSDRLHPERGRAARTSFHLQVPTFENSAGTGRPSTGWESRMRMGWTPKSCSLASRAPCDG